MSARIGLTEQRGGCYVPGLRVMPNRPTSSDWAPSVFVPSNPIGPALMLAEGGSSLRRPHKPDLPAVLLDEGDSSLQRGLRRKRLLVFPIPGIRPSLVLLRELLVVATQPVQFGGCRPGRRIQRRPVLLMGHGVPPVALFGGAT